MRTRPIPAALVSGGLTAALTVIGAALAAALTGTVVAAATPAMNAADSINARQTHYKEISRSFKAIRDELGKPQVDKALVVKNADTMALYAPQISGWFPKGSGSGAGLKTAAREEIWSDPNGFLEQTRQFEERTKKFQAIARNGDVAQMKTFVPQLGGSCKSCHDRFRVKDHD